MDITLSIEAVRGFQVHELRYAILRSNNSLNIYNDLIIFRKSVLMSGPQNYVSRYRREVHATSGRLDEDIRVAVSVLLGF
jgi:hypothetical protein